MSTKRSTGKYTKKPRRSTKPTLKKKVKSGGKTISITKSKGKVALRKNRQRTTTRKV